MDFFHFLATFWQNLQETAPYLLLGLLFAGLLHLVIPKNIIQWALGKAGLNGAVRGALVGTPVPLCSCSVMPTAIALRRQGASLSATTAFTIATPETSIDALFITAAMLPGAYVWARPLAGILLAVFVGYLVELLSNSAKNQLETNLNNFAKKVQFNDDVSCEDCHPHSPTNQPKIRGLIAKVKEVLIFSFETFYNDISNWVLIGFVMAAAVQSFIPAGLLEQTVFKQPASIQILMAIGLGIPIYSCATGTTPLVAALVHQGLNPGAGLALLLSGPATNIGSFLAYKKEWGFKTTLIYYATLFIGCFAIGMVFHKGWQMQYGSGLNPSPLLGSGAHNHQHHTTNYWQLGCALFFVLITLKIWYQRIFTKSL